ncbi:SAV_2336 N-terminal domain-related protein [Nocardia cyriacigeorgica]|uniref:SAV_2336 N-terminal domain-related protein n=1 Tax=Nocardia cyriacigeorgica TaxID=135487 RepID=UPI0024589A2A|nr:SAV_2336 N-terminal domain-related protein [Nocardia cyriacigeorgica]
MSGLSELLDALRELDVDGGTVAEALWLANHIDDHPHHAPPPAPTPNTAPEADSGAPAADAATMQPLLPREAPARSLPDQHTVWPYRTEVAVPAPSPLDSAADLLGELRPLARKVPDARQRVFDEDASVDRAVRTAIAWPATKPALVRQREVALVFDRHPSMAAWSGLGAAIRTLVDSVGFRRVTEWYLDEDHTGALRLATHAHGAPDRPLSVLRDPSGRRVVMVFSACLGDAWAWGTAATELERLAARSPVAIVQPLPNQLWRRTGLDWGHGRITAVIPDRPSPLRVLAPATTTAIPVLELTRGWIRPWAQLLAGERRSAGYPLLRRAQPPSTQRAQPLSVRQNQELGHSAIERVRRFRAASSPEAFRLAASLAQVPLLLPIMRLVQQAVLPGSKRSVLAEVLAGGLIEDADPGTAPPYTVPEDSRVFAFRPDVAEVLREAIPRSDAAQVLAATSRFIAERYDVPGPVFRAAVSRPAAGAGAPFAYLSPETLRRIAPNFPDPPTGPPSADDERRYLDAVRAAAADLRDGDVEAALASTRHALATVPVAHPQRAGLLDQLTALLRQRWEYSGETGDLDEAIAVAKTALTELDDTDAGTAGLTRLGELLLHRFDVAGGADFLTDATRVLRTALDATEPDDPTLTRLSERLADALLRRSEVTGEPLYAWEAIDLCVAAGQDEEHSADRDAVLMFKIARAYLDIAALSEHPPTDLEGQIVEQFRHAIARMATAPTEHAAAALLDTATRVAPAIQAGALPARLASELTALLAALPTQAHSPATRAAGRVLDTVDGSENP